MRKPFKIFKILLFVYFGYLAIAILLGLLEIISVIPLAPGWKLKTPNYVEETARKEVDFEQAIVYYAEDSVHVLSIEQAQQDFAVSHLSYSKNDSITISVHYPDARFDVPVSRKHSIPKDTYSLPDKMLCLSDIEGNFDGFVRFLKSNDVIDDDFAWTYGDGHLVLLGDYFDRGKYVTECLWLIYKLEHEAKKAGGKVHFILGNHEALNLIGAQNKKAFNYVNGKFFANADLLGYEYEKWFSSETELGRWLRSKNSIERIGKYLFVHGGISPELAKSPLSIGEINDGIRQGLDKHPDEHTPEDELLMRTNGPLWYRGLAKEELTAEALDTLLQRFGSERIIIGHTVFDEVTSLYDGKVVDIDLKHSENQQVHGLLITNNQFFSISDSGDERKLSITTED